MNPTLSVTDLTRLGQAADALLSPLAGPSPEAWRRDVVGAMRELFGVDNALFVLPDGPRVRFHSDTVSSDVLARLNTLTRAEERVGRIRAVDTLVDTWFQRRAALGLEIYNEPLNDRMLDGQLNRSTIINEAVRPGGMYDFIGFMTMSTAGEMMLFMGHERPGRGSRFGPEGELQVLRALLPAFRTAHHAHATFLSRRAALGATIDAMTEALVVVGADGRVVHRNVAFTRLISAEPDRARLESALDSVGRALAGRAAGVSGVSLRDSLGAAEQRVATALARYVVRATRLAPELLGEPGGVLLTVTREEAIVGDGTVLAARFGLTPREAEVAQALARRLTNTEIAAALGISGHTAERHTERVLAKLDVRSRQEVAARLQGAPPAQEVR